MTNLRRRDTVKLAEQHGRDAGVSSISRTPWGFPFCEFPLSAIFSK